MNERELRQALSTLIHTNGWKALTQLMDEDRNRLLSDIVKTRPVGDKTYDIAEMQGQVKALEAIPIMVENAIEAGKDDKE